jgi:hypothetical protein
MPEFPYCSVTGEVFLNDFFLGIDGLPLTVADNTGDQA